ncbi:MAG: UDP-3-O-(3-hydroxymyristoyl)glucosamine N-acyltransferase [Acidobacteria bacterium]|nr:UDP-3-O-(3-hydroxymyristoyl)glucosamine N-acyltransferase [Acidobacteriota bacterium]
MRLKVIAERLGCQLEGDGEVEISGVNSLERATASELSFLANRKYTPLLKTTHAAAVLILRQMALEPPPPWVALRCDDPYTMFARALELFYQPPRPVAGIHTTAVIAPSARVGEGASIGPYVVIEDGVAIGDRCTLHAHVVIYSGAQIGDDFTAHSHAVVREHCRIGHRVILQNGVIVGADGFGFAKQPDGTHYKIVQSGSVVIEDDAEIQANACIDRATVGETRIRRGAKIDNLVQVGHACDVGEDSIICSQAGLAGSTTLGRNVLLAGQVGVAGHLTLGDNVIATAQAGIPSDVPANTMVSGYPAIENRLWLKCAAAFRRLPEMFESVRDLKRRIATLEEGR